MQVDAAMNKALEKEVTTKATFKGHLDSYRFCDQVSCKGLQHLQKPCLMISSKQSARPQRNEGTADIGHLGGPPG